MYDAFPAEDVPAGLEWDKRSGGAFVRHHYSPLRIYKRSLHPVTGQPTYYKYKNAGGDARAAELIDYADHRLPAAPNCRVGGYCWFVSDARNWYLCQVIDRWKRQTIVVHPVKLYDEDYHEPWPFEGDLELNVSSHVFRRLRPLKARTP